MRHDDKSYYNIDLFKSREFGSDHTHVTQICK